MDTERQESLLPLSPSQMEVLEEATAQYESAHTAETAGYLLARGIDRELAVGSRLGVVSDPLPEHERFRGFLAIPYLDRDGKPLTIRFRCMAQHDHSEFSHGKYMSLPDDIPRLYGIESIFAADEEIHVTEGELDRLILKKIGLHAVGIPGAHVWRPRHRIMLSGFNRIWVWGDPDKAGSDLVNAVTKALPRAKPVRLRTMDVSDTYLAGGAEALLSQLSQVQERSV